MVRSQSEPRVRESVWRPRTSLMSQKNILKITIRSKNLIVEGTGPPEWTQQPQISVSLQEGGWVYIDFLNLR